MRGSSNSELRVRIHPANEFVSPAILHSLESANSAPAASFYIYVVAEKITFPVGSRKMRPNSLSADKAPTIRAEA